MPVQPEQVEKPKRAKLREPVEGEIYIHLALDECRRVIAVGNGVGARSGKPQRRVCYSNGGNTNRWCSIQAFRKWAKGARLQATGQTRPELVT